jgi:hypothetical protein
MNPLQLGTFIHITKNTCLKKMNVINILIELKYYNFSHM